MRMLHHEAPEEAACPALTRYTLPDHWDRAAEGGLRGLMDAYRSAAVLCGAGANPPLAWWIWVEAADPAGEVWPEPSPPRAGGFTREA
jgi:hypothetical protein